MYEREETDGHRRRVSSPKRLYLLDLLLGKLL